VLRRDYRGRATSSFQTNLWQKTLIIFMALFLILATQRIAEKQDKNQEGVIEAIGNMIIIAHWQDKIDVDVDLWAQAPRENSPPVGYSNPSGKILNLQRDDLGQFGDTTDSNMEIISSRGLPPGEYVVNLHLYRNHEKISDVPVDVTISVQQPGEQKMQQIIVRKVILKETGEQITVARFVLDDKGVLDKSSVNDLYKELREWKAH
jgi:hypothetical protein